MSNVPLGINVELPTLKAFVRLKCFYKEKKNYYNNDHIRKKKKKKVLTKIMRRAQNQNKEQAFKMKKMTLFKVHRIILTLLTSEQTGGGKWE